MSRSAVILQVEVEQRRLRAWFRARRLASDSRAGSWAREEARRRQLRFIRDTWRRLAVMVLVAAAFTAGVAYLAPGGFWRGLAIGALGTATVAVVIVMILEVTGAAATNMGSTAEQWTAAELRPLRKHSWRLINRFLLGQAGDIDHLLIGPAGVIVAETKWRAAGWVLHPPDSHVTDAIDQVTRAADQLQRWDPVKRAGCPVRPVLFLWGRSINEPDDANKEYMVIGRVTVIRGTRAAAHWRNRVVEASPVLSPPRADALIADIARHLAKRDEHEAARQPAPPSLERLSWTASGCIVAGVSGFFSVLEPLSYGLYWVAAAVEAAGVALGVYGWRFVPLRVIAGAWLVGVVGVGSFAATLVALF